jgi:hypothetical protein
VSLGRRRFLAGAGVLSASPLFAAAAVPSVARSEYKPVALSESEMATLIAVLSRLIPSDAQSGGAVEACVHCYIDRSLSGAYSKHLPVFRDGLRAIAVLAPGEPAGTPRAIAERLDLILARLEAGEISRSPALESGGKTFFALLLRYTLEGMFGDPIHGGNRACAGWKLIGYPGIRLFNAEDDQALDAHPAGPNRSVADFGRRES